MQRRRSAGNAGVVPIADARGMSPSAIGGKAASLVQMVELGLRVPPAFVVTTDVCDRVLRHGHLPADTVEAIAASVRGLEAATGRRYGGQDPLLVSVRSGAPISMPGMMDTVLDVGFAPRTSAWLAAQTDEAFARSCHRRFLAGYGAVVLGVPFGEAQDTGALVAELAGRIPQDPHRQLLDAIEAVCRSWGNERARAYRERHGIHEDLGTAVVVQAMVFGDAPGRSGTGVVSSRDPSTGAPGPCGDLLVAAQGTDVVAGAHDPRPIGDLATLWPEVDRELRAAVSAIEAATRDVVDVEFTVEAGTLHLLQSRVCPRAAPAAVRIAVDLVDEGLITVAEALDRVSAAQLAHASRSSATEDPTTLLARGLGASPGAVVGELCPSPDHVPSHDGAVVLVRNETSPDDVHGLVASVGVVTAHGGLVSHAALVARELDLPAVVGVDGLEVDEEAGTVRVGSHRLAHGDVVTIDGATGCVHLGAVPLLAPAPGEHLSRFRSWLAEDRQN